MTPARPRVHTAVTPSVTAPTSNAMTPTSKDGQDAAAVAVLQRDTRALEGAVRDLNKSMQDGFAALNAKIDRVNDIALSLERLSLRLDSQHADLTRAFNTVRSLDEALEAHIEAAGEWRDEHATEHGRIETRWSLARGVALGLGLAYGAVLGMFLWVAGGYLEKVDRHDEQIQQHDLHHARTGDRT